MKGVSFPVSGTLLGRIWGAAPSLQTAFRGFPGGATARKHSEAQLSHREPQIQSKALLRSPAGLQGCPGSEGKGGGKAQSGAPMGKRALCPGDRGRNVLKARFPERCPAQGANLGGCGSHFK